VLLNDFINQYTGGTNHWYMGDYQPQALFAGCEESCSIPGKDIGGEICQSK
jgi:hypothetical protein